MRYLFVFLYIILSAISVVYIHTLSKRIPDDLLMLLGSFYAVLFFNIINIKTIPVTYKKIFNVKFLFLILLFTFFVVWAFTIIIPTFFTPALLVFFLMAWPACIGSYFQYKENHQKIDLIRFIVIGLLIGVFYICLSFEYKSYQYLYLIASLTITGFAGYWYAKISFKMNQHNFNAVEILSIRFWLLFIIPLIVTICNKHIYLITGEILIYTFVLSFISMIIPVYCSQVSIEKIGPNAHSIIIGLTPFAAFVLEKICLPKHNGDIFDGIFSVVLAVILAGSYLTQLYRTYKN